MKHVMRVIAVAVGLLPLTAPAARAQQMTAATISGSVKDAQGGVLPGVTVVLTSETRGLSVPPVVTDEHGDFLVPNLAPDRYTIELTMGGFQTLRRTDITVSGADRASVGTLTLQVGGVAETVDVKGQAALVQAESGERSFNVTTATVESLPISTTRSFTNLASLAPGMASTTNPTRIGGGGAPHIMMDGISTMDPGANNRPSLSMNVESIGEVKVLTSSYQAEYGQSSGVHVIAVTKGGTNTFHGSLYDVERNSDWNSNSRTNILNGNPKPALRERDWGYTIGGPVGKAGGNNRLFFFYAQEYAPRNNGGAVVNLRVPTALERAGDFSQSIDQNGNVYNLIRDPSSTLPCTATNTSGCFQSGGVLGRIPSSQLYGPGLAVLNLYPLPNVSVPGAAYNYQGAQPLSKQLATEPAVKLDYQLSQKLRLSGKYSGWHQKMQPVPGTLPGLNDTIYPHPVVYSWASSGNYALNNTTFVEATYGRSMLELVGCAPATNGSAPVFCQTAFPIDPAANPNNVGLGGLPLLFPDAGILSADTNMAHLLQLASTPVYADGRVSVLPTFAFGNRIANAPPNPPFPTGGGLNKVTSEDFTASITKLIGRHTIKAGYYQDHTAKTQTAAPGTGGGTFRGAISFANNTNNPFDSSFGYANAALGVFDTFQQINNIREGQNGSWNFEGYVQDTWRLGRLTLDYGLRLINQVPQHDEKNQTSNFLPEQWRASSAPTLYVAGCVGGANPCSGNNRQAMNPLTGALLGAGSSWRIGTIVPGTGDLLNGVLLGGEGIVEDGVKSPNLRPAPRFGFAYDLTGQQTFVLRGGAGLFFARGFLNATAANPPFSQDSILQFGTLQTINSAALPIIPTQLAANEYNMPYSSDVQWSGGLQFALPFAMVGDVAYVGHHSWDETNQFNLGAIDFGTAFLPQYQDPTLAASSTPGATAVSVQQMSPYVGFNGIQTVLTNGYRTFHSLQLSLNRRFRGGVQFGLNDTIDLYEHANTAPRLQHDASGAVTFRADQAEQDALLGNVRPVTHTIKGNFVWAFPQYTASGGVSRAIAMVINDWQLSGVWSASTGASYSVGYSYTSGGANVNITGSPAYAARVLITGDPGQGCNGSDLLRQFNTGAFAGPQTNSVGLESSAGYLRGCFQSALDLALARTIRLGKTRNVQFRLDVFNAPNQAIITNRNASMTLASPAAATQPTNLPFDNAGNVIPARAIPSGAGFGVANAYQTPRTVQLQLRFGF
jgi:hypothetical protein